MNPFFLLNKIVGITNYSKIYIKNYFLNTKNLSPVKLIKAEDDVATMNGM